MNIFSDSYVIAYDESARSIAFELPSGTRLFEISLSTLQELGLSEASKFVGERLLLLLPETRRLLTGLPATVDVDEIERSIQSMRIRAEKGDGESLYRLAMLLISKATSGGTWSDIEEAESLLRSASQAGHDEANNFLLKIWPEIKAGYLRE
jgi:TPR repeat protein